MEEKEERAALLNSKEAPRRRTSLIGSSGAFNRLMAEAE